VELVLGSEPLVAALLEEPSQGGGAAGAGTASSSSQRARREDSGGGGRAFPEELAPALLYFATAKNDVQAVRLLSALSGAPSNAIISHGGGGGGGAGRERINDGQSAPLLPHQLGEALARLMSPPAIRQQLRLLRAIQPEAFARAPHEIGAFVQVITEWILMRPGSRLAGMTLCF
jgi:hypothetical protein